MNYLFFGAQELVLLGVLGKAEHLRPGHDGDLKQRLRGGQHPANERLARLVVGDSALLLGADAVLPLLRAAHDPLHRVLQIRAPDHLLLQTRRVKCGFITDVRDVGPWNHTSSQFAFPSLDSPTIYRPEDADKNCDLEKKT